MCEIWQIGDNRRSCVYISLQKNERTHGGGGRMPPQPCDRAASVVKFTHGSVYYLRISEISHVNLQQSRRDSRAESRAEWLDSRAKYARRIKEKPRRIMIGHTWSLSPKSLRPAGAQTQPEMRN